MNPQENLEANQIDSQSSEPTLNNESINPGLQNPNSNSNPQRPIKALRTFAGDVEEALGQHKASAATIVLAEQKRREERPDFAPRPKQESSLKNTTFLTLGITLFFLGIIALGGVYYFKFIQTPNVEEEIKPLLSSSKQKDLVVSTGRNVIVSKFNSEKSDFKMPLNSLLHTRFINTEKKEIKAEEIFKAIGKNIPADLARSFDGEYMFGVYSFDQNEPFIIVKTSDYPISFSGMLRWENGMIEDLSEIFEIPSNLFGTAFMDEELKNKDLRILKDLDNKTLLVYSFIDKNTLIIAGNENVFSALLGKYIINQQVK